MITVELGTSVMTTHVLRRLTVKMMPSVTRVLLGYVILTTLHTLSACTVRGENACQVCFSHRKYISLICWSAGCLDDSNCPTSFHCDNHKCAAAPGKVLIDSITITTTTCDGCTTEGVTALLKGEPVVGYPFGVPCATNVLDRAGSTEFGSGGSARFDGELNGGQNDEEEAMIGGCFHVIFENTDIDHHLV